MTGERALACTEGGQWPCNTLWVVLWGSSWRRATLLLEGKCLVHPHGTERWSLCEKISVGTVPLFWLEERVVFSSNSWSPNRHPVRQQKRTASVSLSRWSKHRALHRQQIFSNSAFKWTSPGRFANPDSPGLTFGGTACHSDSRYLNHLPLAFTRMWHSIPRGMYESRWWSALHWTEIVGKAGLLFAEYRSVWMQWCHWYILLVEGIA